MGNCCATNDGEQPHKGSGRRGSKEAPIAENSVRRGPKGEIIPFEVGGTTKRVEKSASPSKPASQIDETKGKVAAERLEGAQAEGDAAAETSGAWSDFSLIPIDNNLGDEGEQDAFSRVRSHDDLRSVRNGHRAREPGYDFVKVRCDMVKRKKEEERKAEHASKRKAAAAPVGTNGRRTSATHASAVSNPLLPIVPNSNTTLSPGNPGSDSFNASGSIRSTTAPSTVRSMNNWGPEGNYAGPKAPGTPKCFGLVETWLGEVPDENLDLEGLATPKQQSFSKRSLTNTPVPSQGLVVTATAAATSSAAASERGDELGGVAAVEEITSPAAVDSISSTPSALSGSRASVLSRSSNKSAASYRSATGGGMARVSSTLSGKQNSK